MTCTAHLETLKIDKLSRNLKKHFHDEYSITSILQGKCGAWIKGTEHVLSAGDVLLISPGIVHSCIPVNSGAALSYTSASLTGDLIESFFKNTRLYRKFISGDFILLTKIKDIIGTNSIPDEHYNSHVLHCAAEKINPAQAAGCNHSGPCLDMVKDYLEHNYMLGVNLDELAEIAGLSKYYLIHKFRNRYMITPYAYLTNLRISHAKKLLKGDKPLSFIALESGFYDQSHFTNTFISYTGITPRTYRNLLQ